MFQLEHTKRKKYYFIDLFFFLVEHILKDKDENFKKLGGSRAPIF